MKLRLFAIAFLAFFVVPAQADDVNADSCSQADVQTAIDAAVDGDRVLVPSGTCTWGEPVVVPDSKKLTLQGAGIGNTNIDGATQFVDAGTSGSRITGFSFDVTSGSATMVDIKGQGWRVDHNFFENSTGSKLLAIQPSGLNETIQPQGLIDNNTFDGLRILAFGMGNFNTQSDVWDDPLALGTDNAVFVEDNVFNVEFAGNIIDENRGGRYVFRYNIVNVNIASHPGAIVEVHSKQSVTERGSRSWEIYENTFNATNSTFAIMFIRGGTGVAFNNTFITGIVGTGINLDNVRSIPVRDCDGTDPMDSNEGTGDEVGWMCRDQIGASTDEFLWTGGTPNPPQDKDPAYFWSNTKNGSKTSPEVTNSTDDHIQADRDFYDEDASFDGTSGVGVGLLSARPSTCTPKVGYWATDSRELYRCLTTDTWTLYFTEFTYPHPLGGEAGSSKGQVQRGTVTVR
jgi:hypothetical protein